MINRQERSCIIVDMAVPADRRTHERERENVRISSSKRKVRKIWEMRKVDIAPVEAGAL